MVRERDGKKENEQKIIHILYTYIYIYVYKKKRKNENWTANLLYYYQSRYIWFASNALLC